MTDTRELILARLLVVLDGVTGIASAVRDALDATDLARPAAIMQSGPEERMSSDAGPTRAPARFSAVQLMSMTPNIDIYVFAGAAAFGSVVAIYRNRIIWAVLNDATLRGYVGRNGDIVYSGFDPDPPAPEARERRGRIAIEFIYPFRLADLEV